MRIAFQEAAFLCNYPGMRLCLADAQQPRNCLGSSKWNRIGVSETKTPRAKRKTVDNPDYS